MSKTIDFPSGLILKLDQVVSSVSIEIVFMAPCGFLTSQFFSEEVSSSESANAQVISKQDKRDFDTKLTKLRRLFIIFPDLVSSSNSFILLS